MKAISVVVACYNIESFITECVNSIIRQSFRDFEIILVDDGSTDGTGDICDRFAAYSPNVIVIHQDNQGVSAARRTGLMHACGNWVTFVDGDDSLPERALEIMIEKCLTTQVDVYVGSRWVKTDEGCVPIATKVKCGVYSQASYARLLADYNVPMSLHSKLFRKKILDEADVYIPREITNNEDYLYNLFISANIHNVYISEDVIYIYNNLHSNDKRTGRATRQSYDWEYWKQYFVFFHENYQQYNVSNDMYIHSILQKLCSLIRLNKDYKRIDMSISPFDCIAQVRPSREFDIWQNLVIIIYKHEWLKALLVPMMRFHPKKYFT